MERSLRRTRRQPSYRVAVIVLDFDRFKSISDTLGREAGDRLLTQAAQRFESCLRPDDLVVARVDSDEMALLLFDIRGRTAAVAAAQRRTLRRTAAVAAAQRRQGVLAEPYDLGGQTIFAPASMGLAMSVSGDEQVEDLVRDAHVALSEAKSDGQSRLAVFESAARDQAVSNLSVNLAPQDFRQPDLGDYVAAPLDEMALPAGVLRLEVTKGSLISNVQGVASCQRRDVAVAITHAIVARTTQIR